MSSILLNSRLQVKQDQDALERQLWEERRNIHRKYEDKLKAAQTKYVHAKQGSALFTCQQGEHNRCQRLQARVRR